MFLRPHPTNRQTFFYENRVVVSKSKYNIEIRPFSPLSLLVKVPHAPHTPAIILIPLPSVENVHGRFVTARGEVRSARREGETENFKIDSTISIAYELPTYFKLIFFLRKKQFHDLLIQIATQVK